MAHCKELELCDNIEIPHHDDNAAYYHNNHD